MRRAVLIADRKVFLSTPSARRATQILNGENTLTLISIHALREEGDVAQFGIMDLPKDFYPRPPRGGRRKAVKKHCKTKLFLSTPSARRATSCLFRLHCEQSDFYPRPPRGGRLTTINYPKIIRKFLSTPSARRATASKHFPLLHTKISIHALREEGDAADRRIRLQVFPISIHALREEGDLLPFQVALRTE